MRQLKGCLAVLLTAAVVAVGAPARAAVSDAARGRQWALDLINAEPAWATGTGAGITIAVVDSGVDLDHEDLQAKLVPGYNAVSPGRPPQDDHGHGTHVAGIAAAETDNGRGIAGVAPAARIMPVKAFATNDDGESSATSADIEEAVRWAVDHGAKVVNMSFGEELVQPVLGPGFRDVIEYAWSKGVVSVVSAGNNGGQALFGNSGFRNENALVVSAVNRRDGKPAYSSSVGDAKWGIAAPGGEGGGTPADENVISTYWNPTNPESNNYYAYMAGTSMAAPVVSGAIAVLLSLGQSPIDAVNRVLTTAKDVGEPGDDRVFGHGRLDLARAVAGLKPAGGGATTSTTLAPGRTTTTRGRSGTTTTTPLGAVPATTTTALSAAPVEGDGSSTTTTAELRLASPPSSSGSDDGRPWAASAVSLAFLLAVGAGAFRLRHSP